MLPNTRREVKRRKAKRRETIPCGVQAGANRRLLLWKGFNRALCDSFRGAKRKRTRSGLACADFYRKNSTCYTARSHARKISVRQPLETKIRAPAHGGASRTAHALRPLLDLRFPRTRAAGGGRRSSARQLEGQVPATSERAFAIPHRRRANFPALRLPRATAALSPKIQALSI